MSNGNHLQKGYKLTIRDITAIGLCAAMCVVGTYIKIPFGNGAMVHLGSAVVYLVGMLFGGVYGFFAGAIGSAFFDLLGGFSPYTLWSFAIKGVAGLIAGYVACGMYPHKTENTKKMLVRRISACLLAALWTLAGYIVAWWVVIGDFKAALLNIPASLLTSGVGIVVAMILVVPLSIALKNIITKK